MKKLSIVVLFLLPYVTNSQITKNELSYAEAYSAIRYFYPNTLSDVDWRMFNYTQIEENLKMPSTSVEFFSQLFHPISSSIEFSLDNQFKQDLQPMMNPVYWQHYGYGKKNGVYYKSCLVPIDSMDYLYNGLQYFERIQGKFDSIEIQLSINQSENLFFSNHFLVYGWKTGKQIIKKETIRFNNGKNVYFCRLNEPVEDVYFRYFLEGEYGVDIELESIRIIGYVDNREDIILHQLFSKPLVNELEFGNHHSVDVHVNNQGKLHLKSNEKTAFHQIYSEDSEKKDRYFTTQLSNGMYMRFPLMIERDEVIDSISYTEADFSSEKYPIIAKTNLIDAYGHLLHFHPYFNANDNTFKELFSCLYMQADTCSSLSSVGKLIRKLMFPVKDAHMYVYSGAVPTPKKFIGISAEFIGKKCVIKNSQIPEIHTGDRIISFQGFNPWEIYQKNKQEYLGSDRYTDLMAKKYVFIEDTSTQVHVIYERNGRKKSYEGYASYYSDYTSSETAAIRLLKNDIYYADLNQMEADTFIHFIQNTPSIKGLILDGREGIKVEEKILSSLTQDTLFYPLVYVPKYKQPFKKDIMFDTLNQNAFLVGNSQKPFPLRLMIDSRNYSHEETFIHLAKQIPLLKLAGNNSAGCNGMITTYKGLGGFEVRFTGSIVTKIDGSKLYNVGFSPEIKVKNKRSDFKKNKDRLLNKCVDRIKFD